MRRVFALVTTALVAASGICPAQVPVSLNWSVSSGGHHIRCLGTIEDMDGDARPDVLVEIDHTGDPAGHFRLLSGYDGSKVWGVSPPGGVSDGCGYGDMCVNTSPDLNGDGLTEALLGTAWGGRTAYAILADELGTVLWIFDTYTEDESGWVYSIDWINDVTHDPYPEIVFGCGSYNDRAYCVDGNDGRRRNHKACVDHDHGEMAQVGHGVGVGSDLLYLWLSWFRIIRHGCLPRAVLSAVLARSRRPGQHDGDRSGRPGFLHRARAGPPSDP